VYPFRLNLRAATAFRPPAERTGFLPANPKPRVWNGRCHIELVEEWQPIAPRKPVMGSPNHSLEPYLGAPDAEYARCRKEFSVI
jgi:hypothetical protein